MTGHTAADATYREDEPPFLLVAGATQMNGHAYSAQQCSFRCHDFAAGAPSTTIVAGTPLDLQWSLTARHPGDCSLYLSYDEPSTPFPGASRWFKIAAFPGCVDQALFPAFDGLDPPTHNTWSLVLPSWLPSCDHCVLRWEWLSVQQTTDVECFTSCVDVRIVGTAETHEIALPKISPTVQISGTEHLPQSRSSYRDAYHQQFGLAFTVGPSVATYSGERARAIAPRTSTRATAARVGRGASHLLRMPKHRMRKLRGLTMNDGGGSTPPLRSHE